MRAISIDQLEIVGYAGTFKARTLPRVVAPIFRFKDNPENLIFPPFRLIADQVVEPALGNPGDLERMVSHGDVTLLQKVIAPKPNSVLWIERGPVPHYQPSSEQTRKWRTDAKQKYHEAKVAYGRKQWDQAQELARLAFALDERSWQSLALQAAIDMQQGDLEGAETLQTIAADLVEKVDFDAMVKSLLPVPPRDNSRHIKRSAFTHAGYKREHLSELTGAAA
jgi:hypothetical protein